MQAERGALTERTRIAREMHDVIAHHMSMIAVRCETAPYRLPELSDPARADRDAVSWELDCGGLPDGLGVTVFRVV